MFSGVGIQWHGAKSRQAPAIVVAASTAMVACVDPDAGGGGGELDGVGLVSAPGQFGGLLGADRFGGGCVVGDLCEPAAADVAVRGGA